MSHSDNPPAEGSQGEAWEEIEPVYPDFQKQTWRNTEGGEVLSVEIDPSYVPWDHRPPWQVVLLPEDYYNDHRIIEMLASDLREDRADHVAERYRRSGSKGVDL